MNKQYKKWLCIQNKEINERLRGMTQNEIEDCFSSSLSFGTAGLRGIMDEGTNRMNQVNVCKLANAVLNFYKKKKYTSIVIGYDTRHNSKEFAKVFARVMALGGIKVHLFDHFVPTPVLIFSIQETASNMGVMITASHNNKNYNGIKISGADCIQISGDAEQELGKLYAKLDEVELYNEYLKNRFVITKNIVKVKGNVTKKFLGEFYKNKINNSLNIIYSPLNGTAKDYVITALKGTGFKHIVMPFFQKFPSGDFKTCPSPNPEYVETFKECLKCTDNFDADVIVATDPDGDRLGAMIKSTKGYKLLSGNEVGLILLYYIIENEIYEKNNFAISTVVSSPMFFDICEYYGIKYEKTLTGFKNIGRAKKELENKYGKDGFVMAYEESCGYIVNEEFYDKDGIFALLKFCEIASYLKNQGSSIEEYLSEIYERFGNVYSLNSSLAFTGTDANERMNNTINKLRKNGLKTLNRKKIIEIKDYLLDDTGLDKSNFIEYKTNEFSFIIRPSGTEPKLKFYIHAKGKTLDESKKLANDVLNSIKKEIFGIDY